MAARLQVLCQVVLRSMFVACPPVVMRFALWPPRTVARPWAPPDAAWALLDSGVTPCSVPKLSASLSQSVECASRMHAAPRSQLIGVAASGDARFGHARWPGRQVQGQRRLHQLWHLVSCGVAGGSETHAPALTVRQPPNPSVNLTPCGSPRLAFISFWAKHGLPQGAGYLER